MLCLSQVIPARHGSQRLGGKLLRLLKGQTVLQRTYNRAIQAKSCSKLVVATEDVRIKEHVEGFGGKAGEVHPLASTRGCSARC